MNQCTGSKLKEMKLLQFNSLGKSLDIITPVKRYIVLHVIVCSCHFFYICSCVILHTNWTRRWPEF